MQRQGVPRLGCSIVALQEVICGTFVARRAARAAERVGSSPSSPPSPGSRSMKKLAYYAVILGAVVSCSEAPTAPLSESARTQLLPAAAPNASVQPIPNQYIVRFPDNEPSSSSRARLLERSPAARVHAVFQP